VHVVELGGIIERRIPRRRCVGRTPTIVTPAVGKTASPGTVIRRLNAPAPPTIEPPSSAANVRSSSEFFSQRPLHSSSGFSRPK
jgi:hypothetical protein